MFSYHDLADVGLKLSELKKILNPNYNWETVFQETCDRPFSKVLG